MEVTSIPFNAFLGMTRDSKVAGAPLCLPQSTNYNNHLNTVHASAQFALGEAASGDCLLRRFRDLTGRSAVVPVVRTVEVKYRKPARGAIRATAEITDEIDSETRQALARKGRAVIPVTVAITDSTGHTTMTAVFEWFVQRLDAAARAGTEPESE
jgi:hypothetical protein